jgi:hypothetical protein
MAEHARRTSGKVADLTALMSRAGSAAPALEPEAEPEPRPRKAPARKPPATGGPVSAPAQQDKEPMFDARLNLPLTDEMMRALKQARLDDGLEATARIRAMITIWQEDERFRNRVNKRGWDTAIRGRERRGKQGAGR